MHKCSYSKSHMCVPIVNWWLSMRFCHCFGAGFSKSIQIAKWIMIADNRKCLISYQFFSFRHFLIFSHYIFIMIRHCLCAQQSTSALLKNIADGLIVDWNHDVTQFVSNSFDSTLTKLRKFHFQWNLQSHSESWPIKFFLCLSTRRKSKK